MGDHATAWPNVLRFLVFSVGAWVFSVGEPILYLQQVPSKALLTCDDAHANTLYTYVLLAGR